MWAMINFRFGRYVLRMKTKPARWLGGKVYGVVKLFIEVTANISLDRTTDVGKNFRMGASGRISIHNAATFGDNVGVSHDVAIGNNMINEVPVIGNDVFIGRGASILGNVTIGDGAHIAANTLVMANVPAGATAIGVPAQIIPKMSGLRKYKEKRGKQNNQSEPTNSDSAIAQVEESATAAASANEHAGEPETVGAS